MLRPCVLCVFALLWTLNPSAARARPDEPAPASALPPVFSAASFPDALKANKTDGKVLVVKFTAEWCGPCKQMDRTTWRDARIEKWIRDNGVALQVDVDRQPDIAREFGIRAMPTMIAFKGAEPFDRTVGYRDADHLLPWLERVKAGQKEADAIEEKVHRQGDDMSMQDRVNAARALVDAERFDKATQEFLWLWENMLGRDPAMVGVRVSFMASDMQDLANRHAPAREAFIKLRDDTEARLRGDQRTWNDLGDWIALNEVVGQTDKTLEWYDRIRSDPDAGPTVQRFSFRIERLLRESGRWADYGQLIEEPANMVRREWRMVAQLDRAMPPNADPATIDRLKHLNRDRFRRESATAYAALLAAGRDADAAAVAAAAIKCDDTPDTRMALVQRALELQQPRPAQRTLLQVPQPQPGDTPELNALLLKLERALSDHAG